MMDFHSSPKVGYYINLYFNFIRKYRKLFILIIKTTFWHKDERNVLVQNPHTLDYDFWKEKFA